MWQFKEGQFDHPQVAALLERHLRGMHECSPACHVFALNWTGLQIPQITFYTLWDDDDLLGCGALRDLLDGCGEVKSMRTADAHLRKGVAQKILLHIIDEAKRRGYSRLSLETGSGAAFEPALAMYRKFGFLNGPAFSDYQPNNFSQFLHLPLSSQTEISNLQ